MATTEPQATEPLTSQESNIKEEEEECPTFIFTREESKIDHVTVFSSSAEISRTIEQEITEPGEYHFSLRDLPSSLKKNSIRVSGTGNATILDIWSQQKPIEVREDSERQRLHDKQKELRAQISINQSKKENLNKEKELLSNTTDSFINCSNSDFNQVTSEDGLESISNFLNFNQEENERIDQDLFDINKTLKNLEEKLITVNRHLTESTQATIHSARSKYRNEVTIALQIHEAATIRLQVVYLVSGASWRASYDARLSSTQCENDSTDDNNNNNNNSNNNSNTETNQNQEDNNHQNSNTDNTKLDLTYYAHIKQTTGENWENVSISLSTAEPSLNASPPPLNPMGLSFYSPITYASPYPRAVNEVLEACSYQARNESLSRRFSSAKKKKPMEPTGVSSQRAGGDRLMTSVFHIQSRQPEILSNNQEHKVTVAALKLKTDLSYKCVPKKDPRAYLKTSTTNDSDFILVDGNVSVYFDKSFVSHTNIKSVCPMEKFDLFLGPDPSVDVKYSTPAKNVNSTGYFKVANKATIQKEIVITNNKSETPVMIEILDQLPKSSEPNITIHINQPSLDYGKEIDLKNDVSVGKTKAHEVTFDPSDCHVSWRMTINPQSKAKIPFVYTIEWPKNERISGALM